MKQLREDAQRVFELARHAHEPPPDAKSRTRDRLQARLAAGAILSAGAVASKTTLALGMGALGKGPVVALLLMGAASVGYGIGTLMDAPQVSVPQRPKNPKPVAASAVAAQRLTAESRRNETAAQANPTPGAAMPSKSVGPAPRVVPSATAPAPAQAANEPVMPSPAAGLAIETQLIRQAHQSIVSGDFGGALMLLGEHEQRFPAGVLTEERVATQVIAYCRSGRGAEAQARLRQFANRWPKSPHWSRIHSACSHLDTGH